MNEDERLGEWEEGGSCILLVCHLAEVYLYGRLGCGENGSQRGGVGMVRCAGFFNL